MKNSETINKGIFYEYINECIETEIDLDGEWESDNTKLTFKKKSSEGFDIIVSYEYDSIYIGTDIGWHDEFSASKERLVWSMGVVRDLLTKNMRISEYLSNDKPYKWVVQIFENSEWLGFLVKFRLLWNYFGKRSEKIYFNDTLLPREF